MDEETKRKLLAKHFNEHVKLLVTTLNAIVLVIFGGGVLQPVFVAVASTGAASYPAVWIALGIALHMLAQALIRFIRPE